MIGVPSLTGLAKETFPLPSILVMYLYWGLTGRLVD